MRIAAARSRFVFAASSSAKQTIYTYIHIYIHIYIYIHTYIYTYPSQLSQILTIGMPPPGCELQRRARASSSRLAPQPNGLPPRARAYLYISISVFLSIYIYIYIHLDANRSGALALHLRGLLLGQPDCSLVLALLRGGEVCGETTSEHPARVSLRGQ